MLGENILWEIGMADDVSELSILSLIWSSIPARAMKCWGPLIPEEYDSNLILRPPLVIKHPSCMFNIRIVSFPTISLPLKNKTRNVFTLKLYIFGGWSCSWHVSVLLVSLAFETVRFS